MADIDLKRIQDTTLNINTNLTTGKMAYDTQRFSIWANISGSLYEFLNSTKVYELGSGDLNLMGGCLILDPVGVSQICHQNGHMAMIDDGITAMQIGSGSTGQVKIGGSNQPTESLLHIANNSQELKLIIDSHSVDLNHSADLVTRKSHVNATGSTATTFDTEILSRWSTWGVALDLARYLGSEIKFVQNDVPGATFVPTEMNLILTDSVGTQAPFYVFDPHKFSMVGSSVSGQPGDSVTMSAVGGNAVVSGHNGGDALISLLGGNGIANVGQRGGNATLTLSGGAVSGDTSGGGGSATINLIGRFGQDDNQGGSVVINFNSGGSENFSLGVAGDDFEDFVFDSPINGSSNYNFRLRNGSTLICHGNILTSVTNSDSLRSICDISMGSALDRRTIFHITDTTGAEAPPTKSIYLAFDSLNSEFFTTEPQGAGKKFITVEIDGVDYAIEATAMT